MFSEKVSGIVGWGGGGGSGKSSAGLRGLVKKTFDCTVHEKIELLASSDFSKGTKAQMCN